MEENSPAQGDMVDMDSHRKTYDFFVRFTMWNIVAIATVLILMAIFLL